MERIYTGFECLDKNLEKIGVACPVCGKDVVIRKTKKGRKYYGCINHPECDYMSWNRPKIEGN